MTAQQILSFITEIGIVPFVRTPTAESAIRSLEAIYRGGVRAAEVTMTVPGAIRAIEKAIQESDLGLTPSNDGKLVRLPIPQLTEERRKELVKVAHKYAEAAKVAGDKPRLESTIAFSTGFTIDLSQTCTVSIRASGAPMVPTWLSGISCP